MATTPTTATTVAPGITRVEKNNSKGYVVRVCRDGVRNSEYYSDKMCGGKRKALQLAKQSHAALLEVLGPANNSTKDKLTSRNTTGKVGVHLAHSVDNRYPGCEYQAYCASWKTEDGRRQKISFAFNRYGEDEAWELACIARDRETVDREEVIAVRERQLKRKSRKTKARRK
ncbi:transcriptional regulator [Rhodopirellula bahusiensis]|uniref:Transcriptional regulator n=1 Tax=Rhodopirellula bahusiensis TaxID=2014065 RepID=A0A2G1W2S1_9BACT|nr:transcriptional regulator [Rhodopirellula bahusiensis]PHQ33271.1 transcriptional regulator [Rhodopirellula bahusiensis]